MKYPSSLQHARAVAAGAPLLLLALLVASGRADGASQPPLTMTALDETQAVVAATPAVSADYCAPDSPTQDRTIMAGAIGGGIPLPRAFTNRTKRSVIFTVSMKPNRFFGGAGVLQRVTVESNITKIIQHNSVGIDDQTPLGTDKVIIEVTSEPTGAAVLARCTFNLTVTRRPELRDVISVPLRPCVVEGAPLAIERGLFLKPSEFVRRPEDVAKVIRRLNEQTWLPDARIIFRPAFAVGIPVIADPVPPEPLVTCLRGSGIRCLGDLDPFAVLEVGAAATACEKAWQTMDPTQKGFIVVFANRISGPGVGGVPVNRALEEIGGRDNDRLCVHPRQLRVSDVTSKFVVVEDPIVFEDAFVDVSNALAHELGHALLLGHGNGLDDNNNSSLPGELGRREYDQYCESAILGVQGMNDPSPGSPNEDKLTPFADCASSASVMFPTTGPKCRNLRPLQREQARAAAKLAPGASFDMSNDPAGAVVADITLPIPPGIDPDVLIARIEFAETPESALTEISQTVLGALPRGSANRHSIFLDLDNDSSTGCLPSSLGLPTAFAGAEVALSVMLDAAGTAPVRLTASLWKCEGGPFVQILNPAINGDASDVKLQDADEPSGSLLARIRVTLPTSLLGPRRDQVRVQAVAEKLVPGGAINRLPPGEDEGGVIILPAPDLPHCLVAAPVVNPGSVTRIRANGLPPNNVADVFIGENRVATGSVDASGLAEIGLSVPNNATVGAHPITVQVRNSLFEATCQLEVIGFAVTPGDVNGDETVDCADLLLVKTSFGKRAGEVGFDFRADVNNDDIVDVRDLAFVSNKLPVGVRCQ